VRAKEAEKIGGDLLLFSALLALVSSPGSRLIPNRGLAYLLYLIGLYIFFLFQPQLHLIAKINLGFSFL
jgi:hypothetical protein